MEVSEIPLYLEFPFKFGAPRGRNLEVLAPVGGGPLCYMVPLVRDLGRRFAAQFPVWLGSLLRRFRFYR